MSAKRWLPVTILALGTTLMLAGAPAVSAQETYTFTVSLLGGIGGSIDRSEAGFGNTSYQLAAGMRIGESSHVVVRAGTIDFDPVDRIGRLTQPGLEYVNLGGEYTFDEGHYTSGVYVALGAYQLDGFVLGRDESGTEVGVAVGATGDFDVSPHFSLRAEAAGHLIGSNFATAFANVLVGAAIHW